MHALLSLILHRYYQGRSQHFTYRGAKGITRAKRALNASTLNTSWAEPNLKKGGGKCPLCPPPGYANDYYTHVT